MKGLEVEYGFGHSLDSTVVLLDDVVGIFDLTHHDRYISTNIDRIDGYFVGAFLAHSYFCGNVVIAHSLVKEALGCCGIAFFRK